MADEVQKALTYENTKAVLEEFAQAVCDAYKDGIEKYDAIASRKLLNSVTIHTADIDGSGRMKVSINLMDYWQYVEAGRKAYGADYKGHLPPISAIEEWIQWKHIIPGDTQRGIPDYAALTPNLGALDVNKSTSGLAWAIATNIAKKGINPKPILRDTVKETMEAFKVRIGEALAKDVSGGFYTIVGNLWAGVNLSKESGSWEDKTITDIMVL